jgi:hypothetical protein
MHFGGVEPCVPDPPPFSAIVESPARYIVGARSSSGAATVTALSASSAIAVRTFVKYILSKNRSLNGTTMRMKELSIYSEKYQSSCGSTLHDKK